MKNKLKQMADKSIREERVLKAAENALSYSQVSRESGYPASTVGRILNSRKITPNQLKINAIRKAKESGLTSIIDISLAVDLTPKTIRRYDAKAGGTPLQGPLVDISPKTTFPEIDELVYGKEVLSLDEMGMQSGKSGSFVGYYLRIKKDKKTGRTLYELWSEKRTNKIKNTAQVNLIKPRKDLLCVLGQIFVKRGYESSLAEGMAAESVVKRRGGLRTFNYEKFLDIFREYEKGMLLSRPPSLKKIGEKTNSSTMGVRRALMGMKLSSPHGFRNQQ